MEGNLLRVWNGENITKSYGEKTLFESISFSIAENERVGLVGVNGTGKSSLLKIVAQLEEADRGTFNHPDDYFVLYLPQDPQLDPEMTVLDHVFLSDAPMMRVLRDYEDSLLKLQQDPTNPLLQDELFKFQKEMDTYQAWDASAKVKTILGKLGIEDVEKKAGELSGGQKKRVSLAKVLIAEPDLLILDEPTNHLDYETIEWLEQYLKRYPKSILFVTHDRYFLDHLSTHIIELDQGHLFAYKGNYQAFIESKALREEQEQSTMSKKKNLFRNELEWIRRGAKARSTKQKARKDRFEELSDEVNVQKSLEFAPIKLAGTRLGSQVLEFKQANKSYEDKMILNNFALLVQKGERIGITGENGSGKTTFLQMIVDEEKIDSGDLKLGQTVRVGYYRQETPELNEQLRMIEYVREAGEVITNTDGEQISVSQILEQFLFPPSTHGTPVYKLSGGEKRRLYLLRILMDKPNVLLLDEPTNDLDTLTLTVLENYLETFPGVVMTVSHDRYFLDRTCQKLLIFKGQGKIDSYLGTFSSYMEKQQLNLEPIEVVIDQPKIQQEKKKMAKKMTFQEKREWEIIEGEIEKLEEELEMASSQLNVSGSNFEQAAILSAQIDDLELQLVKKMERWEYLTELNDSE
jgi:ATP-binding cassette subfamily F protein uup